MREFRLEIGSGLHGKREVLILYIDSSGIVELLL